MFWLGAVGIPYLALIVMALVEGMGGWDTFSRRVIESGIDACILGIGVSGALFASDQIRVKIGDGAATIAVVLILVDMGITGLCLNLRHWQKLSEPARARLSIFLGATILALNSWIVVRFS